MPTNDLPKLNFPQPSPKILEPKKSGEKKKKKNILPTVLAVIFIIFLGFLLGIIFLQEVQKYYTQNLEIQKNINKESPQIIQEESSQASQYTPEESYERKIIQAVKNASPSVVSIIISKDVPVVEKYYYTPLEDFLKDFFQPFPFEFEVPTELQKGETQKVQIGAGSGFIISKDGMILTNKHVVSDKDAEYTVITQDETKYQAKILARDPVQDLAILKIEGNNFQPLILGDSSTIEIGQTVIAIGNALGEFKNTVSVGVISGLGRTITASSGGMAQTLEDVIQTDAAINQGNSGGPLLNLKGEVIGINTAMALEGENIGFAIPINKAKKDIEEIKSIGKISAPFLGIRYIIITPELAKEKKLPVDYGALITRGNQVNQPAIIQNSPAQLAGLKEGDIILEINNQKINQTNSISKVISKYKPGDKVILKVLRDYKELTISVVLGEWNE